MSHLSYLEAVVVGGLQGITELFPVSSLGHSVLLPALVGGQWAKDLNVSAPESPYLAFIVGLHVATAAALMVFFWRDWILIISGFFRSIIRRRVERPEERLAWLIVIATIPVGIAGLLLEHLFRTTLGRPIPAAAFLLANGFVLGAGEWLRRRAGDPAADGVPALGDTALVGAGSGADRMSAAAGRPVATPDRAGSDLERIGDDVAADRRLAGIGLVAAVLIGSAQILALLPGISRSGATMVVGLSRGMTHQDAARFSFLLATPVILAAGMLKVPDLFGPLGTGIHGQILAGSLASFVAAYVSVRFLTRWFHTRTLTPFAIYCGLAGAASLLWLSTH